MRTLQARDIPGVVALQAACFPPPFDPELLWQPHHLERHLQVFPDGQFVAEIDGQIVGSASSVRIAEARWQAHLDWESTVGGHLLEAQDDDGTTLYGVDISVHPAFRGQGVGRALYQARFGYVRAHRLTRYGSACRIPDWRSWSEAHGHADQTTYAQAVVRGDVVDRTLTPLLRYGLRFVEIIPNYMEDFESGDAAALLEWTP